MESVERRSLNVPVVLGSIRKGRRSENAARLLAERVAALDHRTRIVDLRELNLPLYDEEEASEGHANVAAFRQIVHQADALVWLTPEYNHGYTSASKNAIDYLRPELRRKPVAVCGLSGGLVGGARAVEQFKQVLIELHAVPIRDSVYFSDARGIFDDAGRLLRPEIITRVDEVLAELIWYARTLAWGREHLPIPQRKR
jgi:NAD(P)H-dependent FMN reductase